MATTENIEECFNIFDARKQGYLEKDQLGTVLRALGKNPTEKELKEILDDVGSEKLDINRVKNIYKTKKMSTPQDQDQPMRNAFKALDSNNNGKISEPELRQILGNLGDALTTQEVNALMREAKVDANGGVDYNEFVSMLVNSYPAGDKLNVHAKGREELTRVRRRSKVVKSSTPRRRIIPSPRRIMADDLDLSDLPSSAYMSLRTHPAALMAERTIIHMAAKLVDSAKFTGLLMDGNNWPKSESLLPFITIFKRFMRGFGVGYAGKMVFAIAGLLIKSKFKLGPLLSGLRRASISREVVGYGMATGSFLALFEATMRISTKFRAGMNAHLKVWVSSLVASASILFIAPSARPAVSIFLLVRAIEVSGKAGSAAGYLPKTDHGDVILMAVASAQVIWAWLHHRSSLDPSYLRFLDHQGGRHIIPQTAIATFLRNGKDALASEVKLVKKLAKHRKSYSLCSILHPQTRFCSVDAITFVIQGLRRALWVYLPIFVIPMLFRTKALRSDPLRTLSTATKGIARSSLFLALYCTMCWSTACFISKFGIRHHLIVAAAGFVGGLTVAIEKRGRRVELALYVLQQAIPSAFHTLRSMHLLPHINNFEILVYAVSLGAIMNAYVVKEKLLRPSYISLLDFLFDKSALIERSDSSTPTVTPQMERREVE